MNIERRNFFRLLRAGAFGSSEQVEPMAAWKWRQTLSWAKAQGVAPLLCDGIDACHDQFFMRLPDALNDEWHHVADSTQHHYNQASPQVAALLQLLTDMQLRPMLAESWSVTPLYDVPGHHRVDKVCIYFPFATQGAKADEWARQNGTDVDAPMKHLLQYRWEGLAVEHRHRLAQLSHKLNNTALQHIIEQDRLESATAFVTIGGQLIETPSPTLAMLTSLLALFRAMLDGTLRLWQLTDIGMMLRKQGHQVDYIKLQNWVEKLHFGRMTLLVGQMLIALLGFSPDEVPFIPENAEAPEADRLLAIFENDSQGKTRFFRYCPGESISTVLASIGRSLDKVEE